MSQPPSSDQSALRQVTDRLVPPEIMAPDAAVRVMGSYPGAGVTSLVSYLRGEWAQLLPGLLITDGGVFDEADVPASLGMADGGTGATTSPSYQLLILVVHHSMRPRSRARLISAIDTAFEGVGQTPPSLIFWHRGCGDSADMALSSAARNPCPASDTKTEKTD